jgi:hypothetical protein
VKFDGHIGRMVKHHRRYAKSGRTIRAKRLNVEGRLEKSTMRVMSECRHGVDQEPGLAEEPLTGQLINPSVAWVAGGGSPIVPLHDLTRRVSEDYRAQLPKGHHLSRRQKKDVKKSLHNNLLSYADALVRLEQSHGHRRLGTRIK